MKKRIILLTLLLFPILLLGFAENTKADNFSYVYVWYFKTDRQVYYTDQEIVVNASWSLNYQGCEARLQIQIFNETEHMLWNSIWYFDKYPYPSRFNVTHYIPIRDLFIPLNVSEYVLHVKLYYFHDYEYNYVADVPITIFKRNCSCELFNFENNIDIDIKNFNIFSATFYNESKYLANQLVNVKINNISRSKLTNKNGSIELELRFPNNLTLGKNILILNISNDKFISPKTFEYEIIVNHNSTINTISDKDSNKNNEKKEINRGDSTFKFNSVFYFSLIFSIFGIIMLTIYYNKKKKIKKQKNKVIIIRN